jgi:aminoglycoside 6-adenylyltransferase
MGLLDGMRTERAVLSQLRGWAESTENVRAVILTASRADPHRKPDLLSDYDVEVYVRDTQPMVRDDSWVTGFGSVMVRWPSRPRPTHSPEWITQIVLFDDGVRIDFQVTAGEPGESSELDGGYRVLVDKDNLTEHLPPPSYSGQAVGRPTAEAFASRMDAFWWDVVYVAKGLWRGELNYAKAMLDGTIRLDKLQPLLGWYAAGLRGRPVDVGVYGRWLRRYLDAPTWEHYLRTFAGAGSEDNWRALFETIGLVRAVGKRIAEAHGFEYPDEADAKVTAYIRAIRETEGAEGPRSP